MSSRLKRMFILFIIILLPPALAAAQGGQGAKRTRTFDPPTITVELSNVEPPAAGVQTSYEAVFGGGGGCESWDCGWSPVDHIQWFVLPPSLAIPFGETSQPVWNVGAASGSSDLTAGEYLVACGYPDRTPPLATLTYPGERTERVAVKAYDFTDAARELGESLEGALSLCYEYIFPYRLGMELGVYTLTLEHPVTTLAHRWGVDLTECPRLTRLNGSEALLTGYAPNASITLYFYAEGKELELESEPAYAHEYTFIATRTVKTDESGNLRLLLNVARSSPFRDKRIDVSLAAARDEGGATPTPDYPAGKYPTYRVGDYPDPCDRWSGPQPNQPAQVAPREGETLTLYRTYDDLASAAGTLDSGTPVYVQAVRVGSVEGRAVLWYKLITEDGLEGWTYGANLRAALPTLLPGTPVMVTVPDPDYYDHAWGEYDAYTLRQEPDLDGRIVAPLEPGAKGVFIRDFKTRFGSEWYYIQTEAGQAGWALSGAMGVLPWEPLDVTNVKAPQTEFSTLAVPPPASGVCPGFMKSRLVVGGFGQLIPGETPNRIRVAPPNGFQIGRITRGIVFKVLEGPLCTPGIAWWKIDYGGGVIGWTAEGQGREYWLEPVAVGGEAGGAATGGVSCAGFALPSRLQPGQQAKVIAGPLFHNSLPARPSLDSSSKALGRIPNGATVSVLEGPHCNHDILWWKVEYRGTIGWAGEGTGSEYWMQPAG